MSAPTTMRSVCAWSWMSRPPERVGVRQIVGRGAPGARASRPHAGQRPAFSIRWRAFRCRWCELPRRLRPLTNNLSHTQSESRGLCPRATVARSRMPVRRVRAGRQAPGVSATWRSRGAVATDATTAGLGFTWGVPDGRGPSARCRCHAARANADGTLPAPGTRGRRPDSGESARTPPR